MRVGGLHSAAASGGGPIASRGGIVERAGPIQVSNVAIFNRETGKADRVGFSLVQEDGKAKKIRIFKSTKKPIDG